MRLFWVACITVLFSIPALCQASDFVIAFQNKVSTMHYSKEQDSLEVLLRTKRGNCVAFAKLAAELAIRRGLICESISLVSNAQVMAHRIALVHDIDGRLWLITNKKVILASSEEDAIEKAIIDTDPIWKFRTLPAELLSAFSLWNDWEDGGWEIRNKHLFTKEELK